MSLCLLSLIFIQDYDVHILPAMIRTGAIYCVGIPALPLSILHQQMKPQMEKLLRMIVLELVPSSLALMFVSPSCP